MQFKSIEFVYSPWPGVGGNGRILSGGHRLVTSTVAGNGIDVPPFAAAFPYGTGNCLQKRNERPNEMTRARAESECEQRIDAKKKEEDRDVLKWTLLIKLPFTRSKSLDFFSSVAHGTLTFSF